MINHPISPLLFLFIFLPINNIYRQPKIPYAIIKFWWIYCCIESSVIYVNSFRYYIESGYSSNCRLLKPIKDDYYNNKYCSKIIIGPNPKSNLLNNKAMVYKLASLANQLAIFAIMYIQETDNIVFFYGSKIN